ncbi:MAG: prepilin peptidase [Bacillota bacterium]
MDFLIGYYATLVFILGLVVGSFLNVVIYRVPAEESIVRPPSHCPKCNTQLKNLDLVPVFSWLFLRGKCRYCQVKIPARYALVELLTGILFLAFFIRFEMMSPNLISGLPSLLAGLTFTAILIAIFFIDIDHQIIPNGLVIVATIAGAGVVLLNAFAGYKFFLDQLWWEHLLGVLPGVIAMILIMVLGAIIYKKEALGMGDVKIFIPIGLFLGWKLAIAVLIIAIIAGGIGGVILMLTRKADRSSAMPFGPFIVFGAVVAMLANTQLIQIANWYFGLFIK